MEDSNFTYGFDKQTAQHLKAGLGGVDSEMPDGVGRMTPCLYAKTKSGGIVVGTPALVEIYDKDDVLTDRELLAEARVNDIPGDTEIYILSAYSRWLAVEFTKGTASIEYEIISTSTAGSSSPYNGLKVASVTIKGAPCSRSSLIGTTVDVVDHSGCIFDLTSEQLAGVWGWASERVFESLQSGVPAGTLTPCHWSADNRCCTGAD